MSVIAPGNVAVITGGASGIGLALAELADFTLESGTNPSLVGPV